MELGTLPFKGYCTDCIHCRMETISIGPSHKQEQRVAMCKAPMRAKTPLDGSYIPFSCEVMREMNAEIQAKLPKWMLPTLCGYNGRWFEPRSLVISTQTNLPPLQPMR